MLRETGLHLRPGIGGIDVKSNIVETPDDVARRIEAAVNVLGPERASWTHPVGGF